VAGIDFEVAAGETFGFLGPNGAGKTTTIGMPLHARRPPARGSAPRGRPRRGWRERDRPLRMNIGLVFQDPTLDGYLTAEQKPALSHAELYGVPRLRVSPERSRQVLEHGGPLGADAARASSPPTPAA